jgi:spore coat protein U-like protein
VEGVAGLGGPFFFGRLPIMVDRKSTILAETAPIMGVVWQRWTGKGWAMALAAACSAGLFAPPAEAATQNASVTANVVKPLTLTSLQSLDLGTITLKLGNWSTATVGISRTGVFSCDATNLVCTGLTQVARYNVTGTNKQAITISAPNVTMVNQADASKTLTLVLDSPGTIQLTSSGAPGSNFDIGGSIALSSTTASGTYQGTFNVTVDYQ